MSSGSLLDLPPELLSLVSKYLIGCSINAGSTVPITRDVLSLSMSSRYLHLHSRPLLEQYIDLFPLHMTETTFSRCSPAVRHVVVHDDRLIPWELLPGVQRDVAICLRQMPGTESLKIRTVNEIHRHLAAQIEAMSNLKTLYIPSWKDLSFTRLPALAQLSLTKLEDQKNMCLATRQLKTLSVTMWSSRTVYHPVAHPLRIELDDYPELQHLTVHWERKWCPFLSGFGPKLRVLKLCCLGGTSLDCIHELDVSDLEILILKGFCGPTDSILYHESLDSVILQQCADTVLRGLRQRASHIRFIRTS